jgi:hypothetical protein
MIKTFKFKVYALSDESFPAFGLNYLTANVSVAHFDS